MRISILLPLMAFVAVAAGQNLRTTRHGSLKPIEKTLSQDTTVAATDSVCLDSIGVSRYDKPLRSLRETFFVTNHYADTIVALSLRLRYDTTDGTMLHQRDATVACEIPPGETRQLYLTAWDKQFTYYYYDTRIRPKSTRSVPYTATLTPLTVARRTTAGIDAKK
jgi:hypothetical protein